MPLTRYRFSTLEYSSAETLIGSRRGGIHGTSSECPQAGRNCPKEREGARYQKGCMSILTFRRMSIFVVKLDLIFYPNWLAPRHHPREENLSTPIIRTKERMKIDFCQRMALLSLMRTMICWKTCRTLFESKSNSKSRSRPFSCAHLCALISFRTAF